MAPLKCKPSVKLVQLACPNLVPGEQVPQEQCKAAITRMHGDLYCNRIRRLLGSDIKAVPGDVARLHKCPGVLLRQSISDQRMPRSPRDTKRASGLELARFAGLQFDTVTQAPKKRKVLRRFYEPLWLLSALGQIRGERIKSEINIDPLSPNIQKLRRSFVDRIAYIHASEKEPSRVTAVALGKTL